MTHFSDKLEPRRRAETQIGENEIRRIAAMGAQGLGGRPEKVATDRKPNFVERKTKLIQSQRIIIDANHPWRFVGHDVSRIAPALLRERLAVLNNGLKKN